MGMALGNTVTQDARPFDILAMNNGQPADWDNLLGIIDTWKIGRVVVGLPLNMDGSSSMIAKRAHKFARRLAHRLMEQRIHVPVQLFDERLTSVEAREMAWELGLIKMSGTPLMIFLLVYYYKATWPILITPKILPPIKRTKCLPVKLKDPTSNPLAFFIAQ